MQTQTQQVRAELVNESTTFIRLPNANEGGGDLLEVRVTSRVKMPTGVINDTSHSFVLGGQDAADTLTSLKMIHNNIQMQLMKAQQQMEQQAQQQMEQPTETAEEASAPAEVAEPANAS